jgi:cytochrome c-type biogenesis protein CcmE
MSRIDEELAQVIDDGPDSPPVTRKASDAPSPPKRSIGLLIGLITIGVVVLALVFVSFRSAAVWATTVDQLLTTQDKMRGRRVRVEGTLVHGSLMKRDQPCEYRFKLKKDQAVLDVRYPQCVIPDTLRDRPETDVSVTAEGRLNQEGVFEATQILAKCPSKYDVRDGEKVPVGPYELR